MPRYRCNDEQAVEVVTAEGLDEACDLAAESWRAGSWDRKCLVSVRVAELDADDRETGDACYLDVECGRDPEPPQCVAEAHDWQSPHEVVGGLSENPGVWSTGGTTLVFRECCGRCGAYRRTTSYGSQRDPGQVDTVEYLPPDETSLEWIETHAPAAC